MTMPAWLAGMSDRARKDYFDEHPHSKYNPNPPSIHPLDVVNKARKKLDSIYDTLNDKTGGKVNKTVRTSRKLKRAYNEWIDKFGRLRDSQLGDFADFALPFLALANTKPSTYSVLGSALKRVK